MLSQDIPEPDRVAVMQEAVEYFINSMKQASADRSFPDVDKIAQALVPYLNDMGLWEFQECRGAILEYSKVYFEMREEASRDSASVAPDFWSKSDAEAVALFQLLGGIERNVARLMNPSESDQWDGLSGPAQEE